MPHWRFNTEWFTAKITSSKFRLSRFVSIFSVYIKIMLFFLPEPLSAEQLNLITEGEIEIEATVGGLSQFGMAETLNVKLRQCGENYHLFLKRPTTKGAAYCIGIILGKLKFDTC